ncbi:DUF4013 domain-containing protein [Haloparvum sedimenti]|uniref:DUF4013 domain-containing protein n=1 Tax=Haloparvum sedimenti TaxID=1678448 RepID=UPI00071E823B|nr:DUF4013 domain-containing protein [Haloparvum sedimenti]
MSLRALLAFPVRGSPRLDALLVGSGLHLLAVWIPLVPFVAVAGYLARVLAVASDDDRIAETARPGWRPLGPLLADGVRLTATAVAYLAVPTVLAVVTLGGPLGRIDPSGTGEGGLLLVGSTVTLFTALALAYPLPAALVAVARTRRLRAALDRRLLGVATRDGGYLFAVLVGGAGLGLAAAAYDALNAVAAGFVVGFYVEVVAAAGVGAAAGAAWRRAGVSPTRADGAGGVGGTRAVDAADAGASADPDGADG